MDFNTFSLIVHHDGEGREPVIMLLCIIEGWGNCHNAAVHHRNFSDGGRTYN